jgi:hypothetical protein
MPKDDLPTEMVKQCGGAGDKTLFNALGTAIWWNCEMSSNSTHQTYMNMMYAAYDDVADSYFIGIAGTNGVSGLL